MSKYFKALERAKRERLLEEEGESQKAQSEQAWSREPVLVEKEEEEPPPRPASPSLLAEPRVQPRRAKPRISPAKPHVGGARRGKPRGGVEEHLVSLLNPVSFEAEQYRVLRQVVEDRRKDTGLRVVAVSSPAVGDGKTTTAINLAGALAQAPQARVLLIDADLRRPSMKEHLGLSDSDRLGLVDAILNPELALKDIEWHLPSFNLSVVSAGQCGDAMPYEVLKSPRVAELLQEARERYDCVVIDTPPLVPVPDCRVIGQWVDGFLIVVAAHKTPPKLLEEAFNITDSAKVVGLVFNSDDRSLSGYYSYYYADPRSSALNGEGGWRRAMKRVMHSIMALDPSRSADQKGKNGADPGAP